jgi:hypothetical protein
MTDRGIKMQEQNYAFWAGESGRKWHESTRSRWTESDSYLSNKTTFLQRLSDFIRHAGFPKICEIGFGNGCTLQHLAQNLPQLESLVGLEINEEQVRSQRAANSDNRISYIHTQCTSEYISQNDFSDTVFVTSSTYVCCIPEAVHDLIGAIGKHPNTGVFFQEPVNYDVLTAEHSEERAYVEEFQSSFKMYSHPYFHLLDTFGFEVWDAFIEPVDIKTLYYDNITVSALQPRSLLP